MGTGGEGQKALVEGEQGDAQTPDVALIGGKEKVMSQAMFERNTGGNLGCVFVCPDALGRHEGQRAGEGLAAEGLAQVAHDAEVAQLHSSFAIHQDVCRLQQELRRFKSALIRTSSPHLDVSVYNVPGMQHTQRLQHAVRHHQ